ncbi:MAG: hypothetical protein ACKVHP_19475, partial [Verrucomicrobiales bacterium]
MLAMQSNFGDSNRRMAKRRKKISSPKAKLADTRKQAEAQRASGDFRRAREGFRRAQHAGDLSATEPYLETTAACLEEWLATGELEEVVPALIQVEEILGKDTAAAWSEPWYERTSAKALQLMRDAKEAKSAWVDAVVLAFAVSETDEAPLAAEARGIQTGLLALTQGDAAGLSAALRGVGRQSPFASWKWLLKGWGCLLGEGDRARACQCFEKAGAEGVCGKAATFLQSLHGDGSVAADPELLVVWIDEPWLKNALAQSETAWRGGKMVKAYDSLFHTAGFPRFDESLA